MLLRGVTPPEVGTTRDRIMTRMYMMEQAEKFEIVTTIGMLLAASVSDPANVMGNINKVLDNYKDMVGYASWSNDKKLKKKQKQRTDADILAKVSKLSK